MAVTIFLGAGIAAELVLSLIKMKYTRRGLICWTTAAVVLILCCAVYFSQAGNFTVDLQAILRCALVAAGIIGTALLIDLVSPFRRSKKEKSDLPFAAGENSLNLVLSIASGILCGAGLLLFTAGERDSGVIMLLFPAAASIRQTGYFMRQSRLDSAHEDSPENRRKRLSERISGEDYRL